MSRLLTPQPQRPATSEFEQVLVERGRRSDATIAIAVHSTVLGPALGGARMWHYESDQDAVADARRLAGAMTLKAAAAGLELGGGKGVINAPVAAPEGDLRRALLLDFGDAIESLGGRYITAEDVGTCMADMAVIAERTAHVSGRDPSQGGTGDPSPVTAHGVVAAMRACAAAAFESRSLAGLRVCIIGLGHVGRYIAEELAAEGAELIVTDIRPERAEDAQALGARWVEPDLAISTPCEILAPCALGGLIDWDSISKLAAGVVCGAANNILSEDGLAVELAERGILYAPDFLANAGGIISIYGELHGYNQARGLELSEGIETSMADAIAEAQALGTTPLEAAKRLAALRLDAAAR